MDVAGRNYFGILTVEDVVRSTSPDTTLSARGGRPLACRAGYPRSCVSSCLTSAARCGGTGGARASYWSLRHCPIADSPTRLSRAGFTLALRGPGNHMPTHPVVDPISCGGEVVHRPLSTSSPPVPHRLTNACTLGRVPDKGKESSEPHFQRPLYRTYKIGSVSLSNSYGR
jgi:hypothetical protein